MKSYPTPIRDKVRERVERRVERRTQALPWWAVLLAGVILAVLGGLLIVTPKTGAKVSFLILGITCVIAGIALIISIFANRNRAAWVWRLLLGAGAILLGLALVSQPLFGAYLVAAMILWILGAAVVVGGLFLILQAFSYAGWVRGLLGVLCMLLGSMLILGSTAGPLKAPWAFGIAAIAGGVAAIVSAFNMRHGQPR
jgi:uncharacterized membrane protein HdeD (DUF308 family)